MAANTAAEAWRAEVNTAVHSEICTILTYEGVTMAEAGDQSSLTLAVQAGWPGGGGLRDHPPGNPRHDCWLGRHFK
jgi:hypothetical protein